MFLLLLSHFIQKAKLKRTENVNDMKTFFEHFNLYLQTYNKSQKLAQIIKILRGYPPNTELSIDNFMDSHIVHKFISDANNIFLQMIVCISVISANM